MDVEFCQSFLYICWFLFYKNHHMVLFFNLLIWWITLMNLCVVKNACIPGIKPTWSWCMILLMCCWNLFARIYWEFLHVLASVILVCNFLFLWHLCLLLVSGWWWPHRRSLGFFSSSEIFWKSLTRIGVSSSLNFS